MATYSKKLKYSLKERVIEGGQRTFWEERKKKDGDVARLTGLETEKEGKRIVSNGKE